ncbi:MAG: NAD(P)-dependent oxidoreductase [Nitrospiraceae bacterium]|nr:NAD(P)-dependent oxidoreductase [Nitrospiraceae bacterium]
MKTLVTGATGFIGSFLVEELLKQGHQVTCLVRKTSNLRWIEDLDVKLIYGDCSDKQSLLDSIADADFDYVFHLAGITKTFDAKNFFHINAKGTENLIETVAEKNPSIKKFVYLSSLAAAGPSHDGKPLNESFEPRPVSSYGKSKLEGEKRVLKYKDQMPVIIIRPPAVYGPRDRDMYTLFKLVKKGISFCWGSCYYSLIYVEDLAKGIALSAENDSKSGEVYYLSDNRVYSNEDIVNEISSAVETKPVKFKIPRFIMPLIANIGQKISKDSIINIDKIKELQYSYWTCNSSKAQNELGFSPKVRIKEGVKWTADWYRIHQWL